jgi:hypothetical protein
MAQAREQASRVAWDRPYREAHEIRRYAKGIAKCGRTNVRGVCSDGHRAARVIYCGKRGCGCRSAAPAGEKDKQGRCPMHWGPALRRRYAKAIEHLMWAPIWVEIVITLPPELIPPFRSREGMDALHRIGVAFAFHLFREAEGVNTTLHLWGDKSPNLRPHVNVIVPLHAHQRWKREPDDLRAAKAFLASRLGVAEERVNWHMSATGRGFRSGDKRAHRLRYILRDETMGEDKRGVWHSHLADASEEDIAFTIVELRGLHMSRWHGQLSPKKWRAFRERPEIAAAIDAERRRHFGEEGKAERAEHELHKGCCPACDERMKWALTNRPIRHEEIDAELVPAVLRPDRSHPDGHKRIEGTGELIRWIELAEGSWVDEWTRDAISLRSVLGPPGRREETCAGP